MQANAYANGKLVAEAELPLQKNNNFFVDLINRLWLIMIQLND
jgi:hypothetical protein